MELSKELEKALRKFVRDVMDKHGEQLNDTEVKVIKFQIDRLSKNYKGM